MRWLLLAIVFFTCSCKKTVEKVTESIITDLILNYDWYVHSFKVNSKDSTILFNNFVFDFQRNDQVVATKQPDTFNGTWIANVNELTIVSNFNEEIRPLQLISQTWKIIGSTMTSVRASATVDNNNYQMTLYRVSN